GADDHEGTLSCEQTSAVAAREAIRPEREVESKSRRKHSIDPSLQDRRQAVPPQRELKDYQVGIQELLLLRADLRKKVASVVRRRPSVEETVFEMGLRAQIAFGQHGVETNCVQVSGGDVVGLSQLGAACFEQLLVERPMIGMRVHP